MTDALTQATIPHPALILASASPYRAELLRRLGLEFQVQVADVDETPGDDEPGDRLAARLACLKAAAVAAQHPQAIVIGSDQVAECRGRRLGKPGSVERAVEQLRFCAGHEVVFHTAVALQRGTVQHLAQVPTVVQLRDLEPAQIERYVQLDRPLDCAGALRSEALGISLASAIRSEDPTALIGLPLTAVVRLLAEFGLNLP